MSWSFELGDQSRSVELGHVLSASMPRVPNVPPLVVATGAAHDDARLVDDSSGCNETVLIGTHAGSHVDGLSHVSKSGFVRGDVRVDDVQTRCGIRHLDMTTVGPFLAPGLLLDVAASQGVSLATKSIT